LQGDTSEGSAALKAPLARRGRGAGGEGIVALALLAFLSLTSAAARAQSPAAVSDNTPTPLPVRSVTLFSSGVGYVLREGEVDGDASVPLLFRTTQVNDILKSLVQLDEKGTVRPAIYAARDPIGRTLQSFAVDVTQPMDRAQLLNRLRGAQVAVEAEGRGSVTGRIVGVESQQRLIAPEKTATVEILTVLGDAGLQSVPLDSVRSIRLLDDRLNREFKEALSLLASGSDDRRRQVVLHFSGKGRRKVRVGYVTEAPLWKISYRLVLGEKGADGAAAAEAGKPYLQGWALVENTTDEDWNGVRLSLVSGRPVSFIQDLYQPLYLPRPVVPLDVIGSPYPQLAAGAIDSNDKDNAVTMNGMAGPAVPAAPAPLASRSIGREARGGAGGFRGGLRDSTASLAEEAKADGLSFDYRAGVAAQASGEKAGEQFAYNITVPVSLPRQQAAMIPVVAQDITGDKVSLYNADTGPRFPLSAVRLKNDTGLHLKGGPVTLFDGDTYAGDARMEDIPPGDSRLITYAVDLAVEGERQGGQEVIKTTYAVRDGVLSKTRRLRYSATYTLKNKADAPRTVLVEHPFSDQQNLVQPAKFAERTRDRYRFELPVAAGKTEKLTVVTEQPVYESVGLLDTDVNTILAYSTQEGVSDALKQALQEIARRRRQIADLQSQAAQKDAGVKAISDDQERIRKNMAALDKQSALYKRYVTQLDAQETQIQALRAEAGRLRAAAAQADRDLRAYVGGLKIDA
jgi:hypothetical protein